MTTLGANLLKVLRKVSPLLTWSVDLTREVYVLDAVCVVNGRELCMRTVISEVELQLIGEGLFQVIGEEIVNQLTYGIVHWTGED
jgi:hypothetical protein